MPRLRSAIAPADDPAASSSNAEAADAQRPSSAQPIARSNDSRNASVTPSGGGKRRYGFFSQVENAAFDFMRGNRPRVRLVKSDTPKRDQLQVFEPGDREPGPAQRNAEEYGHRRQRPSLLRRHGREPLLELDCGGGGALALQHQPRHQDRPAQMPGILLKQGPEGRFGRLDLLELDLDQGFPRQEPGIIGILGQPFTQRLDRRLELAVLHHPLGALGVGFDLLAAPLELLTAPARAGRIGVDRRHYQPFSSKKSRGSDGLPTRSPRRSFLTAGRPPEPMSLMIAVGRSQETRARRGGVRLASRRKSLRTPISLDGILSRCRWGVPFDTQWSHLEGFLAGRITQERSHHDEGSPDDS